MTNEKFKKKKIVVRRNNKKSGIWRREKQEVVYVQNAEFQSANSRASTSGVSTYQVAAMLLTLLS